MLAPLLFLLPVRGTKAQGDCISPFDFTHTNESVSAITFPGGGTAWPSGSRISIVGKLTIDQSINLDDLEFVMSPNSSIEITGSGTVVTAVNNTVFFGCTQMWLGITVINGATVKFKETTNIWDALFGLRFQSGANGTDSELEDTYFINNRIGIGIFGMGAPASPFRFAKFSGNVIKAHEFLPLLAAPTSHPYSGTKPHRGIWLTQSNANLEFGSVAQNKIERCRYGIASYLSVLRVGNTRIVNSQNDGAVLDPYDGTDIFSFENTLLVSGSSCSFEGAATNSILSTRTRGLLVAGARISNPAHYGIKCEMSNFSAFVDIRDNFFTMSGNVHLVSAIYVERPPGTGSSIIRNNTINVTYTSSAFKNEKVLIDVVGKQDAFSDFNIESNTLVVNTTVNRIHGIRIAGKGNNYHIWGNNKLSWHPEGTPTSVRNSLGIIARELSGSGHEISQNQVVSALDGAKSFLNAGIQVGNIPTFFTRLCENEIDDTHIGIECVGNLELTIFKRNVLGPAAYGFLCRANAKIPNQPLHENRWTASAYHDWGALHQGSPLTKFFYDPNNTIPDDAPPSMSWSPSYWFDNNASGSNGYCFPTGATPPVTETEREHIDGVAVADTTTPNWETRRNLLYKLMRYPDLTSEDEDASDYLADNATANTSAWQFARAEWLFDEAFKLSPTATSKIGNLYERLDAYASDLRALDEQQAQDTTSYDFAVAQHQADTFARFCSVADSLSYEQSQAAPSVQLALQDAFDYAEGLPNAQAYESNSKNVLLIAIRYALGDSLTHTDTATLRDIAAQCPDLGGWSVYRAPLWLAHEEAVTYVTKDWEEACDKERVSTEKRVGSMEMTIAPNPANNSVQIYLPTEIEHGQWVVSDVAGRPVEQGSLSKRQLTLNTSDWAEGIYFFTLRNSKGASSTAKFVITH
ncbi:MAG: T9SS type A sorting domain-containing protein [Saprospiraceae bacterium]|nr:T9SS type A sorting domain-containing protein [Saprospiraceae bacterium]